MILSDEQSTAHIHMTHVFIQCTLPLYANRV